MYKIHGYTANLRNSDCEGAFLKQFHSEVALVSWLLNETRYNESTIVVSGITQTEVHTTDFQRGVDNERSRSQNSPGNKDMARGAI